MPVRNPRQYDQPEPEDVRRASQAWARHNGDPRDLPLTPGVVVREASVIGCGRRCADLIVSGRPVGVEIDSRQLDLHSRNLAPLPFDAGFYATLRDQSRRDYLSGHVSGGVRRGRILWHELADGRRFLTLPTPGSYAVLPAREVERSIDGVWRGVVR